MSESQEADPCSSSMEELQNLLDRGYAPETREDHDADAERLLEVVRARCDARHARFASVLVDRALGRLTTSEAVDALSEPTVLGDESDRLALRALVLCAKLSLGNRNQPPERQRGFRGRALALAERIADVGARAIILTNWLFAEVMDDQLDEAERLRTEAGAFIESDEFPTQSAVTSEIKARYLSHCGKLALRRAGADRGTPVDAALADARWLYQDAIRLVRAYDHIRVNLQIERADELARLGSARSEVPLSDVHKDLEVAHRAQGAHVCDHCRAYFYSASASFHELAARRIYNRSRAEAIVEWNNAIRDRTDSVSTYEAMKHHLAAQERDKLRSAQRVLGHLMQPQKIFLSHAGADKPRIRGLAAALRQLGFVPWLDENELTASEPLERGLVRGMDQSCAAVFLLTEQQAISR